MKLVDRLFEKNTQIIENINDSLKCYGITNSLDDKLTTYFTSRVHLNMSPMKDLIRPNIIVSYLSACKNVIANKLCDKVCKIPIFTRIVWGTI